jgi:galactose-1-phosphate uridylyltransferase
MTETRVDFVTGTVTLHRQLEGKTLKIPQRTSLELPAGSECRFCQMGSENPGAGVGSLIEDIIEQNEKAFALENKRPMLTPGTLEENQIHGAGEVVILRRHLEALHEAALDETRELLNLLDRSARRLGETWSNTAGFGSIGEQAGGSVAHLHLQMLGSDRTHKFHPSLHTLKACQKQAEKNQLGVTPNIWVPWAPQSNFELRVGDTERRDGTWEELAGDLKSVVDTWETLDYRWAYNLTFHTKPTRWIQVLPRYSQGIGFISTLGVATVTVNQEEYARKLREVLA